MAKKKSTVKKAKKDGGLHRYEMNFPAKMIEEPIMHKLSTDHSVVPNILRGRITAHSAKLEVELNGTDRNIDKALVYLKSKGVSIKRLAE